MIVLVIVVFDISILFLCYKIKHYVAMNTKPKKKIIKYIFIIHVQLLFSQKACDNKKFNRENKNLAVNHDSLSRTLGYITYVNKNA